MRKKGGDGGSKSLEPGSTRGWRSQGPRGDGTEWRGRGTPSTTIGITRGGGVIEQSNERGEGREQTSTESTDVHWELPPELLDGGQGKHEPEVVGTDRDREGEGMETGDQGEAGGGSTQEGCIWTAPQGVPPEHAIWEGLLPPVLQTTGQVVTGETKAAFRRQAGRERRELLA